MEADRTEVLTRALHSCHAM